MAANTTAPATPPITAAASARRADSERTRAVTARLLSLPAGLATFAALAGGVAGFLVGLVAGHAPGLVVSLLVFAASCAGYDEERDPAPA